MVLLILNGLVLFSIAIVWASAVQDLTQRLILLGIAIGIVLYCNIVYCIVWYCNGCVGFNTATDWHFSRLDIRSSTCSPAAVPVLIFVISKLSKSRLNSSSFDCSEFLTDRSKLSQSFVLPPAQHHQHQLHHHHHHQQYPHQRRHLKTSKTDSSF